MADEFTKAALYGISNFNKKVKEKIGIEKLIKLLNEYETPQSGVVFKSYDDYDGTFYGVDIDGETEIAWSDSLICSKKFGWIGWLVENDKINLWNKEYECYWNEMYKDTDTADAIIMELSISDTPIEDLISYLK